MVCVGGDELWQDLDRDVTIQPGVAGAVDLAHSTRPERADHLVSAERRTSTEAHRGLLELRGISAKYR
jgi:hypothetical protein